MEQLANICEQFEENHPVWFWILVRLLICLCWFFVGVFALLTFCVVIVTIVALFSGYGGGWFWALFLAPLVITICWVAGTFAKWLYDEFVF